LKEDLQIEHYEIDVKKLFGTDPLGDSTYFGFEMDHSPFQVLVNGSLLRIDLVVCKLENDLTTCVQPLEIKLTALPDDSTHAGGDEDYGCELVIRSSTILYTALSIAAEFRSNPRNLLNYLSHLYTIADWELETNVLPLVEQACDSIDAIAKTLISKQKPVLMQPIWKTDGKSSILHEHCLDIFVWSDIAFTRLFVDSARADAASGRGVMTRQMRTVLQLSKMLLDFAVTEKINHISVFENLTYNTKTDKSFSANGLITRKYMKGQILTEPRITKSEIKNIILGGGEKLLSPERRFDAMIVNTPGLFD
jgi:HindVP restriction endonuclease